MVYPASALSVSPAARKDYLRLAGLLPSRLLHLDISGEGQAIWYTPPQRRQMLFVEALDIPCGEASVPALLWQASPTSLKVFALKGSGRPRAKTALYNAPFFNVYADGRICMGTVKLDCAAASSLEQFLQRWEDHFFGSYFSHLLLSESPVNENIVSLWQRLVATEDTFPVNTLLPSSLTLNDLLP